MEVQKVLNNSAVICLDKNNREIIVMGRGIAFHKKVGSEIDENSIQKIFKLDDKELNQKLEELLTNIPEEYINIADKIVRYSEGQFNKKLSDNIYISLSDHIYTAIQRFKSGVFIRNGILWEIKRLYKDEFKIGKEALYIIERELDIYLPEDEAGFIAMHIVNAKLNEDIPVVLNMTTLMNDILSIVKYYFKMEFDEESLSYYRFVTHLKFFTQRLFNGSYYKDRDDEIFNMIMLKYPEENQCVERIDKYLKENHNYNLTSEEKMYFVIHISRVAEKSSIAIS